MREPSGGLGWNSLRGAARIEVRLVPAQRERRCPPEQDPRPVVRLAAWRRGRRWVSPRKVAAAELGLGPVLPRVPGMLRARTVAWHPPVWRHRQSPWVRHRVPLWVRDPALPRRPPCRLSVGWPAGSWRPLAWWRPGRPAERGVHRWVRDHWIWLRPGRPLRQVASSTLGRPTGAGAHPSGGPRTGGWRPGRAVGVSPGRQWAGPGARPAPPGCRRPTRRGRWGGLGHRAVVRAWRHRSRGRLPARRRAGRVGSRSLDRSGGPATSRSRHRPGSRAGPSGWHPAPEGWRRSGGRTRASPRQPGSRT
jgi:hypothetical protein